MFSLLSFFIRLASRSRRTLWLGLLSLAPPGAALFLWLIKSTLSQEAINLTILFPQMNYSLYLHFLIPITALFIGTAVLRDEIEGGTLPYLLVRPKPKYVIVTAKMLAGFITAAVILCLSLLLTYLILRLSGGVNTVISDLPSLVRAEAVTLIALLVYLSLFSLLGGLVKRPVLIGLLLAFGWESIFSTLPGNISLFTISHYLHTLAPHWQQSSQNQLLLRLVFPQQHTSAFTAIIVLLALSVFFIVLAAAVLYVKEGLPNKD